MQDFFIFISMGIKKIFRESLLTELATGKTLIVVDVQPEYQDYFGDLHTELFKYINKNYSKFNNLIFLFNGPELGMISENEYRNWLIENGLKNKIAYNVDVYDKGYAFFRICIDNNIEQEETVNLVKFMYENDIADSRDLDEEFWDSFIHKYGNENIRELLEQSDDCLSIPELMDYLKNYNGIVLVGGGVNECLMEVEIALDALGKQYQTWGKFTY